MESVSEKMLDAAREGQLQSGNVIRGFGNALGGTAAEIGQGIWDMVQVPGKVWTGELTPSMEPGPGLASIPEYALNLFGTEAGIAAPNLLMRGAAVDNTLMPHFYAWHGTGAKEPFLSRKFEEGQVRGVHGEAQSDYAWPEIGHGHGSFHGQMRGTGEYYARQGNGSLLRTYIEPDEFELLDHDMPWRNQSEQVQQRAAAAGLGPTDLGMTGWDWYRGQVSNLMVKLGYSAPEAEQIVSGQLRNAGIPGTRYLDLHSRGTNVPLKDKTRNFVIFDPKHVQIKTWNGVPLEGMPEGFNPFDPSGYGGPYGGPK
jgi:hypothetical protein